MSFVTMIDLRTVSGTGFVEKTQLTATGPMYRTSVASLCANRVIAVSFPDTQNGKSGSRNEARSAE